MALVVLVMAVLVTERVEARNRNVSYWTKDLSSEPPGERWNFDDGVELAASEAAVHVIWFSEPNYDAGDQFTRLYYARSVDGGRTFEPRKVLLETVGARGLLRSTRTEHRLAVAGDTVHIVVRRQNAAEPSYEAIYLRSTNGGADFEAPRALATANWESGLALVLAANGNDVCLAYSLDHWTGGGGGVSYYRGSTTYAVTSSDGGATFAAASKVESIPDYEGFPIDAVCEGGRYYVLSQWSGGSPELQPYPMFCASGNIGSGFDSVVTVADDMEINAHDQHFEHKLAVAGNRVHVIWTGTPAGGSRTTLVRSSGDGGATFGAPVALDLPDGHGPRNGLQTVAAMGEHAHVFVLDQTDNAIDAFSSANGGASFGSAMRVSAPQEGGWWMQAMADPLDASGQTVHVLWNSSGYAKTTDGGDTWSGPVRIAVAGQWANTYPQDPQLAIGAGGVVHHACLGVIPAALPDGGGADVDVFYTRWSPPPPLPANLGLELHSQPTTARFDGMQIPAGPDLEVSTRFTVESWIKPVHSTPWAVMSVVGKPHPAGGVSTYRLMAWSGADGADFVPAATVYTSDGTVRDIFGPGIKPGTWHHMALTYDADGGADNMKLYVDGQPAAQSTATGEVVSSNRAIRVGTNYPEGWPYNIFNGCIDELRFWNVVRSGQEIADHYRSALSGDEPGLVGYFPLDGTTLDATGNGNDGVLSHQESFCSGAWPGAGPAAFITSPTALSGKVGASLSYQITATNAPTDFRATGLPGGLTFNGSTGVVGGSPTEGGIFAVALEGEGSGTIARGTLTVAIDSDAASQLFYNGNTFAVMNGPSSPTTVTFDSPVTVTTVETYHYFNGGNLPGTIGLLHSDGTLYGPWQATGRDGQGGVLNAYWTAAANMQIPAGTYTVIDSDPATWSYNAQSGGAGIAWIFGNTGTHGVLSLNKVYHQWEANAGMNELVGVPNGNPDGDSLPNWLEHGLGTDPLHITPPVQADVVFAPDGRPGIRYRQPKGGSGMTGHNYSARGVRFSAEVSTTLAGDGWVRGAAVLDALASEVTDLGDGTEAVSVYWNNAGRDGYLRLTMDDELSQTP